MKNKYQKPAIYLTPEHTEGIYLASVNWNNVAGNVALTLSFNTPIDQVEVAGYSASTSISGNSVTVSFNPDGGSSFNLGLHVNHSGADINSLDMTGQSYTVS